MLEKREESISKVSERKERILFMLVVASISIILSTIVNELRFELRYKKYGDCVIKTYENSVEAIDALQKLDSTYVNNQIILENE